MKEESSRRAESYSSSFPPEPTARDLFTLVHPRVIEESQSTFIDRGLPIPERYGLDRMQLMVCDPESLFVYWEITPEKLQSLGFKESDRIAVRLLDMNSGIARLHDAGFTDNWWFKAVPDHAYRCDLGIMNDSGNFRSMLVSNAVLTPRGTVSNRADEDPVWAIAGEQFLRVLRAAGLHFESLPMEWLEGIPLDLKQALARKIGITFEEMMRRWVALKGEATSGAAQWQQRPTSGPLQGRSSPGR